MQDVYRMREPLGRSCRRTRRRTRRFAMPMCLRCTHRRYGGESCLLEEIQSHAHVLAANSSHDVPWRAVCRGQISRTKHLATKPMHLKDSGSQVCWRPRVCPPSFRPQV